MFCRKCGQEIKPGAKFCTKCGTPVQQQTSPQTPSVASTPQAAPASQVATPQVPVQPETKVEKKGKGLIIGLICLVVILLVIGAVLITYSMRQSGDNNEESDNEHKSTQEQLTTEEITQKESESAVVETEKVTETEKAAESIVSESTEAMFNSQSESTESAVPHTYDVVVADVTWTDAYQQAKNVPNGYLVTFETQEEMDQVLAQITQEGYEDMIFMIGMTRRGDSEDYHWVDAEGDSIGDVLNTNANWLEGEPTLYDEQNSLDERYVDMFYSKSAGRWVWNDISNDVIGLLPYYSGKVAYIVEKE